MKSWLSRFFDAPPAPTSPLVDAVLDAALAPDQPRLLDAVMLMDGQARIDAEFLAWVTQSPAHPLAPLGAREERALQHLDSLLADARTHATLLPRAAAMVPQLLAQLRAESGSLSDLSQHVSRDVTLVGEVIRMANSPYFRRVEAVVGLEHAIRVLGVEGLSSAIARVVLKPLVSARGGELVSRSAERLWEHTDTKAQLCAALARSERLDPFEAYLLGLVHNAAWNAVLRAMDNVRGDLPWRFGSAFVAELSQRRARLFAVIAQQWQLQGTLKTLASDIARRGLAADSSPQVLQLYAADRLAWSLCDPNKPRAEAAAQELLAAAAESVCECYEALAQPSGQTPR